VFWNKKNEKDLYIQELKNTLNQSVSNTIKILKGEPVRNLDEFIEHVKHLCNKKL